MQIFFLIYIWFSRVESTHLCQESSPKVSEWGANADVNLDGAFGVQGEWQPRVCRRQGSSETATAGLRGVGVSPTAWPCFGLNVGVLVSERPSLGGLSLSRLSLEHVILQMHI